MTHQHDHLQQLLRTHDIRHTDGRMAILEHFDHVGHALSQPDLEKALGEQFDRVTIYRTLTLYLEKGILHKVLDDSGAMKYALCPDTCGTHDHQHEHVHFKCLRCGNTSCIEDLEVPRIVLPKGYTLSEANFLLSGVCLQCNAAKEKLEIRN
ncbi:MAG: transcriptional repressor [Bacteroidetes bacterium]|jgi:Fur family ferric uptake transcriptional regulator|nr:transcriptional repressor [Bacteroidota bacterium]MBL0016669.1 transcriptional repressor [Bacteroidota bacterium]MBP6640926.1 transcriptional repressor [Bacteroidia bacterium]MBP6721477.1 transcriptional repressor [Bacteroidia bacterium]